jgi:hypothetical protein
MRRLTNDRAEMPFRATFLRATLQPGTCHGATVSHISVRGLHGHPGNEGEALLPLGMKGTFTQTSIRPSIPKPALIDPK